MHSLSTSCCAQTCTDYPDLSSIGPDNTGTLDKSHAHVVLRRDPSIRAPVGADLWSNVLTTPWNIGRFLDLKKWFLDHGNWVEESIACFWHDACSPLHGCFCVHEGMSDLSLIFEIRLIFVRHWISVYIVDSRNYVRSFLHRLVKTHSAHDPFDDCLSISCLEDIHNSQ